MPTIHFRGRIIPEHEKISTPPLPSINWRESTHGPNFVFTIQIVQSVVHVACVLDKYNPSEDISTPLIRAIEFSRGVLDCLCFAHALGLSLVLEWLIEPDGTEKAILFKNSALKRHCTAFNLTPGYTGKGDFAAIYFLVMVEPPLFLALNERIVAITIPAHITVNCARAIESLRTILVPNDPDRAKGWAELRTVLHLERSYLEFVIKASAEPRHGDKTYMEQAKGQEILERSWIIMNRFLEFRKRGSTGLPVTEFPILN
jgi:hypothetical protein